MEQRAVKLQPRSALRGDLGAGGGGEAALGSKITDYNQGEVPAPQRDLKYRPELYIRAKSRWLSKNVLGELAWQPSCMLDRYVVVK